jgi:ubiquinone/menaquinone biosynthesis C-methylase UbiE
MTPMLDTDERLVGPPAAAAKVSRAVSTDDSDPPHSAAYLGAARDFWWNHDYLELLARRFDFAAVESVLDVGAGIGHWGLALASVLPSGAAIVGLERDPRWVAEAERRCRRRTDQARFRFDQGVAEALPYEDETFDLVTCQTLLMHVADPEAVIGEMARVTKRGGLVLASEPNNAIAGLVDSSVTVDAPVEARLEATRFSLLYQRGKMLLDEGNSSVGDLVPGYLARAGLTHIQVYLNDKPSMMIPPYEDEEQRSYITQRKEFSNQGSWWGLPREETRAYFVAGGGQEAEFDATWARLLEQQASELKAIEAGELHTAGGDIHYIMGGRRAV